MASDLIDRLRAEIRDRGSVPFARFMELALYDPADGYYARGPERLGPGGDFFTASDAGTGFGRSMARQLVEIDRVVGPFDPFDVVEFGAGRGLLAHDTLEALERDEPELARRVRYVMVERSARMRAEAAERAPAATALDPGALGTGRRGCVIAVELFDALPVHRVRRVRGELVEVHVTVDERGALVETERPAAEAVRELAERYGAAAEEGREAEVAPAALEQLGVLAAALERGVLIIVDYGYDAAGLADPRRARGTLMAYHRHTTNEDYLERVGEQDLTAHVNFSALEDRARELGLRVLGRTTQDRFLIGNGILDAFEAGPRRPAAAEVKRRMQAMQLIHPSGMGRRFQVLILARECRPARLAGLADPFSRDRSE